MVVMMMKVMMMTAEIVGTVTSLQILITAAAATTTVVLGAKVPLQPEGKHAENEHEYGEQEEAKDDHETDKQLRVVGVLVGFKGSVS